MVISLIEPPQETLFIYYLILFTLHIMKMVSLLDFIIFIIIKMIEIG